ncbi:hypothetical protein Ancab_018604 [Ancistrocladus abbreviatus]
MMVQDCNALIADLVVISCCCQCLILQIVVFILLKLPRKIARKIREYAEKLGYMRRGKVGIMGSGECRDDDDEFISVRIEIEGFCEGKGQCIDEVEKVLEELSMKGEFAFGSFWGRDERGMSSTYMAKEDFPSSNFVQFHLIPVIGPFSGS